MEHRQALFISGPLKIEATRMLGKDGKHIKLFLSEGDSRKKYEAVLWNRAEELSQEFQAGSAITIAYTPRINEFMGDKIMQLDIKDWKHPSDVADEFFERFKDTLKNEVFLVGSMKKGSNMAEHGPDKG
jgi:hypothetical protein